MVIEGWREAIRIQFEYCIPRDDGVPPPPSKVGKVLGGETLGVDFCSAALLGRPCGRVCFVKSGGVPGAGGGEADFSNAPFDFAQGPVEMTAF